MASDFRTESVADTAAMERGLAGENLRLRGALEEARVVAERYALMLREGDHRIKNSLQIVASLVRLQAGHEPTEDARKALNAAAMRIQAIGRIHDALQQGLGKDIVDVGEAVRKMCGALQEMAGDVESVEVHVDAHRVMAPVALAQPLVLTVNELVVNALRHGFSDGRRGEVLVTVGVADGRLWIVVADNGIGMPTAAIEGGGYGMRLVRMMAEQMHGNLLIDNTAGTRVTIDVPEPSTVEARPGSPLHVENAIVLNRKPRLKNGGRGGNGNGDDR